MINNNLKQKAQELIEEKLRRAAEITYSDLMSINMNLPTEYQYNSIREIQTVMVKGAFDALGFSVELELFTNDEATDFWKVLHERYSQLWPSQTQS
jgi:hypothetical protein